MVNQSKLRENRFRLKWLESGALGSIDPSIEENVGMARESLGHAKKYSIEGDAALTEVCLGNAQKYGRRVGIDTSSRAPNLLRLAYTKAVPVQLKNARKYARSGEASIAEACLEYAKIYADHIGVDISTETAEIKIIAYTNTYPVDIKNARKYAEEGEAGIVESCLTRAEQYGNEVGIFLPNELIHIRHLAYTKAVPVQLEKARKYAEKKDMYFTNVCLGNAQMYGARVGIDTSVEATEIRAIASRRN
ncbi:MAG: hypothetical protein WCI72_03170 [archaeon]